MAFLVVINFLWGLNFIAVKLAVEDLPPLLANALRFTVVLVLLLPWLKIVTGRMKDLLLVAFTLGFLHFGTVFVAMSLAEHISAVAIAAQLNVPFATLLAVLFLGEQVGWKRVAGIALSFAGVVLLGFDPRVFAYLDALALVVFSALVYAVAAILMRRLHAVRATTTQAWVAVAGVSGSALLSMMMESGQAAALAGADWVPFVAVVYSGVASSIIGHGGVNYLLRKYEVSVISPYLLLMPLFAIINGIVFLGETLTLRMVIGGALTLLGVAIVTLRNSRRSVRLERDILEQEQ